MFLSTGSILQGGKYRILSLLGQGGFGITYLAEHTLLGRKVAVKEFFMKDVCNREDDSRVSVPSLGSRELVEKFRIKFLKEARLIATFNNPHIISVYDVFEENGTAYYVMEYLEGKSLSALVAGGAGIDEEVAVGYVRQVAKALSDIHSRNLLHLDVKPANIMLKESGEAVLIDFGISKHYDEAGSQTSSGLVGLSEGYAPMEQYKKGGISSFSPATDIYSLGATLYKLLTGITPPHASDVYDDGLPALPDGISANVRRAVETAMQPRRKERPQSAAEFIALLDSENKAAAVIAGATVVADSQAEPLTTVDAPAVNLMPGRGAETAIAPVAEQTKPATPVNPTAPVPPAAHVGGSVKKEAPVRNDKQNGGKGWLVLLLLLLLLIGVVIYFVIGENAGSENSAYKAKKDTVATLENPARDDIAQGMLLIEADNSQQPTWEDSVAIVEEKPDAEPETVPVPKKEVKEPVPVKIVEVEEVSDMPEYEEPGDVMVEEEVEDGVYGASEVQPSFPGGTQALLRFISENLKYPRISRENGSTGTTVVRFAVEKDGSIANAKVLKSSGDIYLDKEAIRVVSTMPKWSPGMQNHHPVRVWFNLPINFRLQ